MTTLRELEDRARAELERLAQKDAVGGVRRGDAATMANALRLVNRSEKITEEELRLRARAGQL